MAIPKLIYYSDNSYVTSEGTLFEGFETFADWTKAAGDSIEANSVNTREGVLSLKLNSVNGAATVADKTISKDFSAVTNFIIWIYIHDLSTLEKCALWLSSTADWSKNFNIEMTAGHFKAGWNRMVVAKAQFGSGGGEVWSNTMIRLRFKCEANTGEDTGASFDDLRYDYAGKAKCILTFDDTYANTYYRAKPIMDTNGQAGVAFVIIQDVGVGGKLSIAQMMTMQNAGWDISNHTYGHWLNDQHLAALSQVEMEEAIDLGYDWLVDNGFSKGARFFGYPWGEYNQAVLTKVKERHRIARSTIEAWNVNLQPHFNLNDDDIEFLVRFKVLVSSDAPATVQGWIDNAIIQKGLLSLGFHNIVESGASGDTEYNQADFETISDYLKTKEDAGLIDIITFSDYDDQFMPSDLTSVVYLEHGPLVPFPIAHEPSESVNRSEDKRIKVYGHSLAGDRKRIWRFKCIIDDQGSSGYKWRDLEYFYWKVVEGAKRRCVFVDANSVQYLVRIIGFAPKAIGLNNRHEVTMILEEDYT